MTQRYAIVRGMTAFILQDGETFIGLDGQPHVTAEVLDRYNPSYLPKLGVYPVEDAAPAPTGSVHTGDETLEVIDTPEVPATDTTPAVPASRTVKATYAVTALELDQVRAERLKALSDLRTQHMSTLTLPAALSGATIVSDDTTANRVDNAIRYLTQKPEGTVIDFEVTPGHYAELDVNALNAFGIAVGDHWQAAFANSKTIAAEIMAADTPEAVLAVDLNAGWNG